METVEESPQTGLCDENSEAWNASKNKKPPKSMEMIEKTLETLGLSKHETQVYLYLALYKELKATQIAEALNLHRTNTYRLLRDLEKKGIVSSVFEKPMKFIAAPFDRAIDTLIETKKLRIQRLENKKKDIVNAWLSLPKPEAEEQRKEVFQILEGEEQINLKAAEAIQNAQQEINVFASEEDLPRFYNSGFMAKLEKLSKKNKHIHLLTCKSPKSRFFIEKIKLPNKRYVSADKADVPSFILADQKQLVFMIKSLNDKNGRKKVRPRISALWTNYDAFMKALNSLFSELWNDATD
jgi:sugar-specific transcriptional regulator TrmB